MSYQDLQINLTGKDVSASDSLRALARAANTAAKSAGDSLEGMNRRVEDSSQRSLHSVTGGFGSGLASWVQGGLIGIMGGMAASVTSTVTSAVSQAGSALMGELKSTVIDYNSQLENATIGFTTMLGSGSKATDFLNTLQAFAQRTPFQFGDLTQYAQQMIGYGIKSKDVIKDLSALGDAASGTGRLDTLGNAVLAFEQMAARGKVDLGDLYQLSNAGVPALKILANQYHVSTGEMLKMISTGKVMSSDALPKLTAGIEKGTSSTAKFGGMMNKQSGTFTGAMSNIQDSLSQTLSTAFRPFYKMIENVALGISKFATSKAIQKWAADASKLVGQALNIIGSGFRQVFGDPKMQKSVGNLGKALGDAFKGVGPDLQKMMPDLVKFGKDVFPAIVDGITTVVKHFPQFMAGVASAVHELAKWGPAVATFIDVGAHIIGWLIDAVANFQKWHDGALKWIIGFITDATNRFKGLVSTLTTVGGQVIDGLVKGIEGGADAIRGAVKWVIDLIPAGARKLLGIASPSKVFHQIGTHVGEGLSNGLLGSAGQVQGAADKLANTVIGMFEQKKGGISSWAESSALRTIRSGTNALIAEATRRATVGKQLAAAEKTLTKDLAAQRKLRDSTVIGSTVQAGDVTQFASAGAMVGGLSGLVARTNRFRADLTQLTKKGIDQDTFRQLIAAGVDGGGLQAADQLLANPSDFKQIVALQRQLAASAGSLGSLAGNYEYAPTIARDRARVATLKGAQQVETWRMQKTAAGMLNAIARETHLHIHIAGTFAGSQTQLAKSVVDAIRQAVKQGHLPKSVLTAL